MTFLERNMQNLGQLLKYLFGRNRNEMNGANEQTGACRVGQLVVLSTHILDSLRSILKK